MEKETKSLDKKLNENIRSVGSMISNFEFLRPVTGDEDIRLLHLQNEMMKELNKKNKK